MPLPNLIALLSAALLAGAPSTGDTVSINRVDLSAETLRDLGARYHVVIPPGRYWYDPYCGAWGLEGGPTLGFVLAGLPLGGPMPPDASGGGTAVFINGRELHPLDVAQLANLVPIQPGRYWVDAQGNAGHEGGPALVNLFLLARGAGKGSPYSARLQGGNIGSDGDTYYYFDRESGTSVMNNGY